MTLVVVGPCWPTRTGEKIAIGRGECVVGGIRKRTPTWRQGKTGLDVEFEVADVAVFDDVFFAFGAD